MSTNGFRRLFLSTWLLLALLGGTAQAQLDDILSGKPLNADAGFPSAADTPESLVTVAATLTPGAAGKPATLAISADIAPPWHTYSTTQDPGAPAMPTRIKLDDSAEYKLVGEFRPNLPPRIKRDSGHVFEEFGPDVTWTAPVELAAGVDPKQVKVSGSVRIQICNTSCLQPTEFPFTAELVAVAAEDAPKKSIGSYSHPNIHATLKGYLEPKTATPGSTVKLVITAQPSGKWHVYERADRDNAALGYKPTLIALANTSGFTAEKTTVSDKAKEVKSADLPPQRYHDKAVTWTTNIVIPKDAKPGEYPIAGLIGYQTCDDAQCDAPRGAKFEGAITVGAAEAKGQAPLAFSDAKYGEAAKLAEGQAKSQPAGTPPSSITLPVAILFGLIGGFILNFMPCVLPVIGLKILSFAQQAGRSRRQILTLNIWYSLGLLSVFMVLATLASAVSLGLGDSDMSWGQQFQLKSFTITMIAVVFVMALSFLGVWEIPIPGFVGSGKANEVAMKEGAIGAFAKGALTTVLATPCSGPLLGVVFGYTIAQPPLVTYLLFGCIGLGMASPYLLIGAYPSLLRFLPKPGAWMETFKQMMGFVLLGTIVFLFTSLDRNYFVPTFAMMVGLWAACWWIGRTSLVETFPRKAAAWLQGAAVAAAVGLFAFSWLGPHESLIRWQNFSRSSMAQLARDGHTVMVDFTAEWCPNCKTNSALAIETDDVLKMVQENRVVPMLADWTEPSDEIKDTLLSFRSRTIPLLVIFPAGKPDEPIVLRDLISKQQVLDALKAAGPSKATEQAAKPVSVAVGG